MGKKTKGNSAEKAMAKAAKKTKQEKSAQKKALKDQRKEQSRLDAHQPKKAPQGGGKKNKKPKANEEEDLDALLEQFKKEWETEHDVQEERQSGPPSRRANATLTACPLGTDLWLFGGEYFDGERYVFHMFLRPRFQRRGEIGTNVFPRTVPTFMPISTVIRRTQGLSQKWTDWIPTPIRMRRMVVMVPIMR